MLNKKPKLSDYGLTQEMIDKNNYSLENRDRILKENTQIIEKAGKVGWGIFWVGLILGIIISASNGSATAFFILTILGSVIGYFSNKAISDSIKPVPQQYNKEIAKKYEQYKADLIKYDYNFKPKANTPVIKPQSVGIKQSTQKTTQTQTKQEKPKITLPKQDIFSNLEAGMYIKHSKFGEGYIVSVDNTSHLAKIFFSEDNKYKLIDYTLANFEFIRPKAKITTEEPTTITSNQSQKYEIGMKIKHKTFGIGIIHDIDSTNNLATIKFNNYSQTKKINYTIAKLEIQEEAQRGNKTDEKPHINVDTPQLPTTHYVKIYNQSRVKLTQEQFDLFEEMLTISKKYCVDIDVSEWKNLVGVGLIGQEHLRYWLLNKSGTIYVKFAELNIQYPFTTNNKEVIIAATKHVNECFEENPDAHLLNHLKPTDIKDDELEIDDEADNFNDTNNSENNSFNNNTNEEPNNINQSIIYDKSIFNIQGTKIIKFNGKHDTGSYTIPEGITEISEKAFYNNNFVFNLDIPDTVTTIKDNAFNGCKKLKNLMLPSSITYIGEHVFDGCENLETIFCTTKRVKNLLKDLPKHIEITCLE